MDCIRCLILNPSLFCRCFKNSFSSFSRFSLQNKETIHVVAMFYFYTTFYSSVWVENALIYRYQMTQTMYIYFIKATRKAILAARERQRKTFCSTQQKKFFWILQVRKSDIATTFKEDVFGIFSFLSVAPSLPRSRFLDVTQRSFGGALRDIQKTAARETKLPQTLFQSEDKYKAIDMKMIFYFSCKWNLFSQEKFCTWLRF